MQSDDRVYFRRRSVEEIHAAMRADSLEAMNSHVALAELHLRECAGCVEAITEECDDCLAVNICPRPGPTKDLAVRPGSPDGGHPPSVIQEREIIRTDLTALSPQEENVLQLIARGLSAREIGQSLGTTRRRVERHIDNLRSKLNARNAPHLITRAIVVGVLTLPIQVSGDPPAMGKPASSPMSAVGH